MLLRISDFMTIKISGAIFLTNGMPLDVTYTYTNTFNTSTEVNGVRQKFISCKLDISNGNMTITIENVEDTEHWKNIQNMCRSTLECFFALHLLKSGTGLLYTLNNYEKSDGTKTYFPVDMLIEQNPPEIDELAIVTELGRNMKLRDAYRDYNSCLTDRYNLPFFLYREAETITRAVRNLNETDKISISKIKSALKDIGVPEPDILKFDEFCPDLLHPTRHGRHPYFKVADAGEMYHLARHFLICATKYLVKDSIKERQMR